MATFLSNPYAESTPTIAPTERTDGDYQNITASPEAFGASIARGAEKAGGALEQAGFSYVNLKSQMYSQATGDQATNQFMDFVTKKLHGDPNVKGDTGYLGLSGADAMAQQKASIDSIEQARQRFKSGLGPSASIEYENQTRRMATNAYDRMGQHYDTQTKTYAETTNKDTVSVGLNALAQADGVGDTDAYNHAADRVRDAMVKSAQLTAGNSADPLVHDKAVQDANSVIAATTFQAKMTAGKSSEALSYYEAHKNEFTAQELNRLEPEYLRLKAGNSARDIMNGESAEGASGRGLTNAPYTKDPSMPGEGGVLAPRDLYLHLIQKGATKNEALMLTSAAGSESSYNPNAVHDNNTGHGLWGHKDDRLNMSGINWQQLADAALQELRRRPEGAAVNSATTADQLAIAEMHYEQPSGYTKNNPQAGDNYTGRLNTIRHMSQLTGQQFAPGAPPDRATAIQRAMSAYPDDFRLQDATVAEIHKLYNDQDQANADVKANVVNTYSGNLTAAEDGKTVPDLDEGAIRQMFPKQAERMIAEYGIARFTGEQMRGMEFASPQQVQAIQQDLNSGRGVMSDMFRTHAKAASEGPGVSAADAEAGGNNMFQRFRDKAANRFNTMLAQREKALGPEGDPAAYAMNSPTVRAAMEFDKANPPGEGQLPTAITANLAAQTQMGVKPEDVRILTKGQALAEADKIMRPGADAYGEIQNLQKTYGDGWTHVFGDMVKQAKLPASFQAVAALPDENDARQFARALQQDPKEKPKDWAQIVNLRTGSPTALKDIDTAVETNADMKKFGATLQEQGVPDHMQDSIISDVKLMAYSNVAEGKAKDASSAVARAVASFTGKYEMPDDLPGIRMPKASYQNDRQQMERITDSLDLSIAIPPPYVGMPGRATPAQWLAEIKANNKWVNTEDATGVRLLDGSGRTVRDRGGQPIVHRFGATTMFEGSSNHVPTGKEQDIIDSLSGS